ncbi:MAG: energy transducer TonB [Candidatus Marinarcus sp.]|uniref:energy transducer TonB n=1 Tax=Candidatus Marinarcus sp. TaxID=3100987 RepID=UPI003B00508C
MKNLIAALILSIFIHLIFFTSLRLKKEEIPSAENKNTQKVKSSNVRFVQLKSAIKQQEPQKKVEEKKEFKEAKKPAAEPKRKVVKEASRTVPKPRTSQEVKPNFTQNVPKNLELTPLQKEQQKLQKETLTHFLATPDVDQNMLDEITKSYLELYGEEYNSFSQVQKIYLKNNLRDIGRITQRYLRYPILAGKLRQQGTNIVEFILHPNGDISNLRLTNSSGSNSLDENSIETIKIAYKDYPKPKEPTKVKIYVNYTIY